MRLVAWNLRSGTDRKLAALQAWQPDIAVISEAVRAPKAVQRVQRDSAPALPFDDSRLEWEWEGGSNESKGIAIASWGLPVRRRLAIEPGGRWAVGVALHQLLIIGLWSCPKRGGTGNYGAEVERSIGAFMPQIARHHELIVAGDFNVAPRTAEFDRLRALLESLDLVSTYHLHTGDPFGHESAHTFHSRHGAERSQHIDYVWCSRSVAERITSVVVGPPGPSDHSPIIVDLEAP